MNRPRQFLRDDSGVVAPMAILLLVVLLGFSALVLDVGMLYAHRRSLQNAADAAALAAAGELELQIVGSAGDPVARALGTASKNGVKVAGSPCQPSGTATVTLNQPGPIGPNETPPRSWQVETTRLVRLVFGAALGRDAQCVRAQAIATVTELKATKVWPWAVLPSTLANFPDYGATFTLKQAAGGGAQGNYGIVDFDCGGGGATQYEEWIYRGFGSAQGESVPAPDAGGAYNWRVCTETGNKANVNRDLAAYIADQRTRTCPYGVDTRCPIIGLVPILKDAAWPNGQKPVTIMGFAVFELQGLTTRGGTGQMEIQGRFLQFATGVGPTQVPRPDGPVAGLLGVRLWR